MDRKKRLNPESRRAYLEGLRKYREKGVPILIDGKEADERQWVKFLKPRGWKLLYGRLCSGGGDGLSGAESSK